MATIVTQDAPAAHTGPDTPGQHESKHQSVTEEENTSGTTIGSVQQADKKNETVTVRNGCYYPWETGLEKDTAMQGLIDDAMKAWDTDPKDPNYPCGKIENGGAVTIYIKYECVQNKEHNALDGTLKKAGRKWGKERPPDQQKFISNCVRTLQENLI